MPGFRSPYTRLTSTRPRSLGNRREIVPCGWLGKKPWPYFKIDRRIMS